MSLRVIARWGVLCVLGMPLVAQVPDQNPEDIVLRVDPSALKLVVGGSARLKTEVVDVGGRPVEAQVMFFSRSRRALAVDETGNVTARQPGSFEVVARAVIKGKRGPSVTVPVTVLQPDPVGIEIAPLPERVYSGDTLPISAKVVAVNGVVRNDLTPKLASADRAIADFDSFGRLAVKTPGRTVIRAQAEGLTAEREVLVLAHPVVRLDLPETAATMRTGDVVAFAARAFNAEGEEVPGMSVTYAVSSEPDDQLGQGATGQIDASGRFVAENPGMYTIVATCGNTIARTTVKAEPRFKEQRKLMLIGRGEVHDAHTSDLWVWEGVDGRDYAVTGTWGANGEAHFWDVTAPSDIKRIATVTVDARTVNDVKVSEDGRICVLSREGASNRKNGIVILDVSDPHHPKQLSTFDDELTGGVHNVFISKNHVYALSAGRRYDVINIEDPTKPHRVGSYQVFEPGASIHDVWVEDGIAYSSNWRHGVHLVDVGNGIVGGSPSNPKKISSYAYPSGWNHAAFPFKSQTTGKNYVVAGDEAFPFGLHVQDKPTYARGWLHFIDFTDLKSPKEAARFQVPEAGTHNLWIEGDLLYAAFYNGGVRVVDVSGDLQGDLYKQGREVAWFMPTDKKGVVPNAPMVWGPQPHKGHVFFSDWNTGLWAMKLTPEIRQ